MRLLQSLIGLLLVLAVVSVAGQTRFPKDVYPETGNRFPAVRTGLTPDAFGPGAIRQYSPPVAESMTAVNDYLRRAEGGERARLTSELFSGYASASRL